MPSSVVDTTALLAIDIGTASTRVLLFDVVNGHYRFVISASAPTTAGAPFFDVSEGIRHAIEEMEGLIGRPLIGNDENLIMPSMTDNSGIDMVVSTMSAGKPIKVVAVGLLEDITLASARRLAATTYAKIVDVVNLNDRRKMSDRINAIMRVQPDLIIVAGGTDNGASKSVLGLIETIGLANYLIPKSQTPHVLFAGNKELQKEVHSSLGRAGNLHIAPNIRPTLETEDLSPAQKEMSAIYKDIRRHQTSGIDELLSWSNNNLLATSTAFGRIIRFLSKKYDPNKGVLGVDIGSKTTTVASAFNGEESLKAFPYLGVGVGIIGTRKRSKLQNITRWFSQDIPDTVVENYIYNKTIHPHTIPVTKEELAIEQAIARQALRLAVRYALPDFPQDIPRPASHLLPWFEPIIATGSVISKAPSPGQSLLMLLDGLQPTGVSTITIDQNNITAALGAASQVTPLLTVQIIESNIFFNLGTVIAPVGNASYETPVLRIKMTSQAGAETIREVKYGTIEVLPVKMGERVKLHLRPLHNFDVGMGAAGKAGEVQAVGGAMGIIIDARGRPLQLSSDANRRKRLLRRWNQALRH